MGNSITSLSDVGDIQASQDLIAAAAQDDVAEIQRCLDRGGSVNYVQPKDGSTALMRAAHDGKDGKAVAYLLENSANPAVQAKVGIFVFCSRMYFFFFFFFFFVYFLRLSVVHLRGDTFGPFLLLFLCCFD
jgi:ankyrin repeat protein